MNNTNRKYRKYKNSRRHVLLSGAVLSTILIVFLFYVIQGYMRISIAINFVFIPLGVIQFYYFYGKYSTNKKKYERE